jgi:hypothetical protein
VDLSGSPRIGGKVQLPEIIEEIAKAADAKIGMPEGYGNFVIIEGGDIGSLRLASKRPACAELRFTLATTGKSQSDLLEKHIAAGDNILASIADTRADSLPGISSIPYGYICKSEWRVLWRN